MCHHGWGSTLKMEFPHLRFSTLTTGRIGTLGLDAANIATLVAWSSRLSVGYNSTKTDEPIEVSFGVCTRVGPGNHLSCGAQIPHGKEQFLFGWHLPRPIVKCWEYPACGRYSQPYSGGGSSDAAFRCQLVVQLTASSDSTMNPISGLKGFQDSKLKGPNKTK